MSGIEIIIFFIGGLVLLFVGGEWLIRGSSNLAIKIGITPLIVGLIIVAFGTSAPELVVSLRAAIMGNSSISLGNVIGSNIANIGLIIGVGALIKPLTVSSKVIKKEIPIMIGFSILLVIILLDGEIGTIDGLIFLIMLVIYCISNVLIAKKEKHADVNVKFKEELKSKLSISISIFLIFIGLTLLIIGGNLFLKSAIAIARLLKLSDVVIGLTIVSIGTSLPELVTSIIASYRRESEILLGSIVGSNVFNILSILGITALITPINSVGINYIDLGVMIFFAIILLPLSKSGFAITRLEGAFLVLGYMGYMYYLLPK